MIRLEKITKIFNTPAGQAVAARDVDMDVPEGEICVLLGPSGCGKTTTLKMVNRLIMPTSGKIFINGEDTSKIDTVQLRRSIGYVIQQIGLFPNMTIEENIGITPKLLGWDSAKTAARAAELLDLVGLDPNVFLKRFPKELSGGQQQRIGVIRALAADPPVMLMDEPFGAIDPINRQIIQDEFLKMQAAIKKTIMFVSHDIDEAVKMGDKIAIFKEGVIEQYDSPDTVLAHPANAFIADFVGTDRTLKRLRLVTVEEVADPGSATVSRHTKAKDALSLIQQSALNVAVMIDQDKHPVGYVTEEMLTGARGIVRDLARPLPVVVPSSADLRAVVSEMFAHDIMWLATVNHNGRFVGVVTQPAVTRALGETYRQDMGPKSEQGTRV